MNASPFSLIVSCKKEKPYQRRISKKINISSIKKKEPRVDNKIT